jgi:streptogramin lyase
MRRVNTASPAARDSRHTRFRTAVAVSSLVAATVGAVLLATRDSGEKVTTRGITATLRVPGHPGSVVAGPDALWVALNGDPRRPVGDRPLLRLDLATGTVAQTVHLGGEVSSLARVGQRLIASVKPVGDRGFGPRRLVALDWRSGAVLPLGESHLYDTDAREFDGPVDRFVSAGNALWALEVRPGRLLRLDPLTLAPASAPIRLSNGRTLGLAAGAGYLWVTAADAGEVLRIDPANYAIRRVHVGGFPLGIVVTGGSVWFADRSGGNVVRLDPGSLRPIGDPIRVGTKPTWLAVAGRSLFVTDQDAGTIARLGVPSGRKVGPPVRIAPPAKDAVAPAVASTGESVWVSSFASNTVTRITSPASPAPPSSEVTLKGTANGPVPPGPNGTGPTDGRVSGIGQFTISGAIDDKGTYTQARRVTGQIAKIRTVIVGKKGTIIFVTTIHLGIESPAPWTITSGTKSYAGLHGKGRLTVDNYESNPYNFVMKGTVSR